MCSHRKDKDVTSGHVDTTVIEKKKTGGKTKSQTKPSIHQNDKIADTAILPESSVSEDGGIDERKGRRNRNMSWFVVLTNGQVYGFGTQKDALIYADTVGWGNVTSVYKET